MNGEWNSSDHPRDGEGKFTEKENASTDDSDNSNDTTFSRTISLSSTEWAIYFQQLAKLKIKYGENALTSGEIPPIEIEDKIIVSYGTFEQPKVVGIIKKKPSYLFDEEN